MGLTRAANDVKRTDGTPIGIHTEWAPSSVSSGTFTLKLVHLPSSISTTNGYGNATGGETDAEVSFPIDIE